MSAREAFIPSRGFEEQLGALRRRYERASRRLDWNSATQDIYLPGPVAIPVLDLGGPVTPVEADQTVLAELPVDRGQWVVFGSGYGSLTRAGSDFPYDWPARCGLMIYADNQVLDATAHFAWMASTPLELPASVVGTVLAEEPTLITLRGWVQMDLAVGSAEFSQMRLTAVPG